MSPNRSIYLRRLALATLFAGAATFSSSAFGDPVTACAAPVEWNIESYDSCVAAMLADYQSGDLTFQQYHEMVNYCCVNTGGEVSETQGCVAPTGEQAQEAERQPAPPEFGIPGMTLWMPPPTGPAGPPPNEAVR